MARRGPYRGEGAGLRPLVAPTLSVLVCGYNPSIPAYWAGHYYANPSNRFYHLLHAAGLTPRLFSPAEDVLLPGLGIGLTDLCPVPSAMAHDLCASDFLAGVAALRALCLECGPRVLCCNGFGVYRALTGQLPSRPGLQQGVFMGGAALFAMPSSSGAASALTSERLAAWQELAAYLRAPR